MKDFVCVMATTRNLEEIEAFLNDALIYFTSDLLRQSTTSVYQNTSHTNVERKSAEELASRCQELLKWIEACNVNDKMCSISMPIPTTEMLEESTEYDGYLDMSRGSTVVPTEYVGYLDMSSGNTKKSPIATACNSSENLTNDYVPVDPMPVAGEKRIECIPSSPPATAAVSVCFPDESNDTLNSPYAGLPAAHLTLKKSPKQGPLTLIEKRIFFDQSKKYFCGVVDDWLLCYTDGSTSLKPTLCVHLAAGTEVEGYGEGKRRDISFQITSVAEKRYIFQASSEVEAKAWICAIEGTVRGVYRRSSMTRDAVDAMAKNRSSINNHLRKLPTPPPELWSREHNVSTPDINRNSDEIYQEPSCPLYKAEIDLMPITVSTPLSSPPNINEDYDVPKPLNATTKSSPVETTISSNIPSELKAPPIIQIITPKKTPVKEEITEIPKSDQSREKSKNSVDSIHKDIKIPSPTISTTVQKARPEIQIISPCKTPDKEEIAKIPKSDQSRKKSKNSVNNSHKDTKSASPTSSTPVRNWFKSRMNKNDGGNTSGAGTSSQQQDKNSGGAGDCVKNRLRPRNLKENFNSVQHSSGGGGGVQPARILVASAKGENVNKIVNKLVDANGRLPIFRGGGVGAGGNVLDEKSL